MNKTIKVCDLCQKSTEDAPAIPLPGGALHVCGGCQLECKAVDLLTLILDSLRATPIRQCHGHDNQWSQQGYANLQARGLCG